MAESDTIALHSFARSPGELAAAAGRMLAGYAPAAGGYDELIAADGSIRPHWRRFIDGFAALGEAGRDAAAEGTMRSLRESGIAFNVYADPDDRAHAWRLDLLPLLLPEAEWARLEAGIIQRARLIDAVLRDLYGEARLLSEGVLPPALALASDEFLRPCVRRPGHPWAHLYLYACDIARTRDGSWRVLADQTDAAVGNGYALASRVALSHGLAGLFMTCNVRRLAPFYQRLQEAMQAAAVRSEGRTVVLSSGPSHPSYFSHAYLARYLGYTLVEAADLTVRDSLVYLKTLDGLQRVDLVLREVPGRGADPLELASAGRLGVAGLVQAARSGQVVIANALGSGLAQHRAIAPFAPALCRRLLGEELLLADPPSFWLGDSGQRRAALTRLAGLEIGPVHARNDPGEVTPRLRGGELAGFALERFIDRLPRDGHRLVAQAPIMLATAPSFHRERLLATPYALRTFVVGLDGDFTVLPGGLVRLSDNSHAAALPNGFGSKDLWITGAAREPPAVSLLRSSMHEVHLRRTGRDLLSRTADNLFWLGRYAERAEGTMRLLRSALSRLLEDRLPDSEPRLIRRLVEIELEKGGPITRPLLPFGPFAELEELIALHMYEQDRAYALRESLSHVQRTATLARDQISHDAWRMLNALHVDRRWRTAPRPLLTGPALELLDEGIRVLNAFSGTEAENMTRNYAWRFLEMGRRIERAMHLVELVRGLVEEEGGSVEEGALRLLLELGDSFMTYRSRYVMTPLLAPVIDLLLLDESNPRSLAFQLKELDAHLGLLPSDGPHRSAEQRLVLRVLTDIRLADLERLAGRHDDGELAALSTLLDKIESGLPELSDRIATNYFAHAEAPVVTVAGRQREGP